MKGFKIAGVAVCLALAPMVGFAKGPYDQLDRGPKVGMTLPVPLEALDRHGRRATRASLTGKHGLVLLFSRSVGWCVYCKGEAVDWNRAAAQARALGFNVAIVTYDKPATIARFMDQQNISYPILSDKGSRLIKAFGLLNERHEQGSFAFGIPHPITFIVDTNGVIRHRFSKAGYHSRPDIAVILKTLKNDNSLRATGG